jgi:Divergent InlB B-repeat domain
VKVFKTQLNREVSLDELVTDNTIVPQNASQVEVAWEIVQAEPASNGNGNRRRRQHQGTLNFDTRSVIRRFETYAYTGAYDPMTHQALCADTLCNAPGDGEVGDYIGAQMAAANVIVASVSVTKTGNGNVSSADRTISCGSKCAAGFDNGTQVTLSATAGSGSVFAGWGGACSGSGLTCVLSVTEANSVVANFAQAITLSVKTSGKGSVAGPEAGINCGRTCSANVPSGTVVTLTATPEAGYRFANWAGACTGTGPNCTLTVSKTATAQANFVK